MTAPSDVETLREAIARCIAQVGPGEDWPSNEALGGSLTGTRDDEYRHAIREQADELIADVVGPALAEAWDRGMRTGTSRAMRHMSDEPDLPFASAADNPWANHFRTPHPRDADMARERDER